MSEQCELCLGYSNGEFKYFCPECIDKAMSYDVCVREKNDLHMAIKKAIEMINEGNQYIAIGYLKAAIVFNVKEIV